MATIIDSLLVKLGLDSSEFDAKKSKVDKGLKDTGGEADKTGAKLKKTGKDGEEGFETVAKSAAKKHQYQGQRSPGVQIISKNVFDASKGAGIQGTVRRMEAGVLLGITRGG